MSRNKYDEISFLSEILISLQDIDKRLSELETKQNQSNSFFDINELSRRTGFKVQTLYKKLDKLTIGVHYFKPNGGKLFFDNSCVELLVKGGLDGKGISKERQSLCVDNLLLQ